MKENKEYMNDFNDVKYNNIQKIEMLEDGSAGLILKESRRAIVEIVKMNEKFQAAIYRFVYGSGDTQKKKNVIAELSKHTAYNECMKEALGWVDENPGAFELEEYKEPGKK